MVQSVSNDSHCSLAHHTEINDKPVHIFTLSAKFQLSTSSSSIPLFCLLFSPTRRRSHSLLPLLSIFITLMHKHYFSFFLLNLSCCLSPTLHILSLALSHARTHANSRTQLYALHMVAAAVVLISSGSIIFYFFSAWEQFLDTLSNLN